MILEIVSETHIHNSVLNANEVTTLENYKNIVLFLLLPTEVSNLL